MSKHFDDLGIKLLSETLQSSGEETVKYFGPKLLIHIMTETLANPVTNVLVKIVKALIADYFKKVSSVDSKLDTLIAEPLQTAISILHEILILDFTNDIQKQVRREDLTSAFEKLRTAYSYAKQQSPESCIIVRIYQAIVAALIEGREPYTEYYVGELKELVTITRKRAREAGDMGRAIVEIDPDDASFSPRTGDELIDLKLQFVRSQVWIERNARKATLLQEELTKTQYADDLETYCNFAINIMTHV